MTWGRDANGIGLGAYLALGSSSFDLPQLSLKTLDHPRAERVVQDVYSELADPARSWAIVPPDYTLALSRADTKAMELAPGESVQLDFAVTRGGSYEGGIDPLVITTPEGISASQSVLSDTGGVKTVRVTFSAPVGTPEASYPIRLEAKATGADAPGSLLVDVRAALDGMLDVAASPVIAANATWIHLPNDPVQRRPSEIVKDASPNANTWSWHGYARIGRQGKSILAVGKEGAAVSSAVLSNAAQAQRMNAQASACLILLNPSKTKVGTTVFAFTADGGSGSIANGAAIRRVEGGWGLRTALAGVETDSPDILPWTSGNAELGIRVTALEVILTDKTTMRSIRMARPAWPDAGVRATYGGRRTPSGTFADLGRANVAVACGHPYALTDLELRRTLDKLRESVVISDGKPELPDGLYIHSQFNDQADTGQANEKRRNYAAVALNPEPWQALGNVTYPDEAVQTDGGDNTIFTTDFTPFSGSQDYECVVVLNNLNQGANYVHHFSVASLDKYNGYWGIGKRFSSNPQIRALNDNADQIVGWLPKTGVSGRQVYRITVTEGGRKNRFQNLATDEAVLVDRGSVAGGQTSFSVGGSYAVGNTTDLRRIKFPAQSTGLEVLVHRGQFSAQEVADLKTLLVS